MKRHLLSCAALAAIALGLCSCHGLKKDAAATETPATPAAEPEPVYAAGSYEAFVAKTGNYPVTMSTYLNKELLKKANGSSRIYIVLSQQRGRLYVGGKVAADWPVSTGVSNHKTPTGTFSIQEKQKSYASNRYGKIYDANGKCVKSSADISTDSIPSGGKFVGSPMPNWMRLTGDGVGMHTGKVRAGRKLSHGCIRTPNAMAERLYSITSIGTRVTVSEDLEAAYPAREILKRKEKENAAARAFREALKNNGRSQAATKPQA